MSTVESDAEGDQNSCLNSKSKKPRSKLKVEADQDRTTQETETELQLLDLYCGCGAMSTGLCLGTNLSGVNLVTVQLLHFPLDPVSIASPNWLTRTSIHYQFACFLA